MKLTQTLHFKARFGERNIDFEHVKQAIKYPDLKRVVFGGKIKVIKNLGSKTIEVVYSVKISRKKSLEYVLITVYYI